MRWTTKQFAMVTGVSVRTLHYYHEIGLLKSAFTDEQNGYRFYDGISYRRMKEIMFYHEFGLTLEQIRGILSASEQEKRVILLKQKKKILAKKERLERLLSLSEQVEQGGEMEKIVDSFVKETATLDAGIVAFYDLFTEADRILKHDTVHEELVLLKTVKGNIYHMFQNRSAYEPMKDIAFMDRLVEENDTHTNYLLVLINPKADTMLLQDMGEQYYPEMPGWCLRRGLLELAPENKDTLLLLSAGEIFTIKTLHSVQPPQAGLDAEWKRICALRGIAD